MLYVTVKAVEDLVSQKRCVRSLTSCETAIRSRNRQRADYEYLFIKLQRRSKMNMFPSEIKKMTPDTIAKVIQNVPDYVAKQLQEQIMRALTSEEMLELLRENTLPYRQLMSYYRCAAMEIETKFRVLNEQFSLQYDRNPIETIKSRIKSQESIIEKLRRKNYPFTLKSIEENIRDVAGVRVICSFPEDIYLLADCLLKQDDITLIEKKDYIQNPKESGYRSLHLIVEVPIFLENEKRLMKAEVQLRTIAMDFWASLEHKLRYKKDIPQEEAELLAQELVECARVSAQLDVKMEDIRNRIAEISKE